MKQAFSSKWVRSSQPRKQRKYRYNSPLHIKHKFLSAHLSKELRKTHGRNLPLRKGDEVVVMRGSFKGKKGKVTEVFLKKGKISIENLNRSKRDGTKVNVLFNPSNLQIISLDTEDKKRIKKKQEEKNAPNKSESK